jgi:hypothetical protein
MNIKDVKIRDYFAAQLMSGQVNKFYTGQMRKLVKKGIGDEKDVYVTQSNKEATLDSINKATKMSYIIADSMMKARDL